MLIQAHELERREKTEWSVDCRVRNYIGNM